MGKKERKTRESRQREIRESTERAQREHRERERERDKKRIPGICLWSRSVCLCVCARVSLYVCIGGLRETELPQAGTRGTELHVSTDREQL
jgi:hypothetical protein